MDLADSDALATRHIALVGLMGAGKTTVGRTIARRLMWALSDSDMRITAETGRDVRSIRDRLGTDRMHEMEAEHLLLSLASLDRSVICAAGSVVDDDRCIAALKRPEILTVWLRASSHVLASRFVNEGHRPSYGNDVEGFLAEQITARQAKYASVAELIADTDSETPTRIADRVIVRLHARQSSYG